jgi:hypothetical protein
MSARNTNNFSSLINSPLKWALFTWTVILSTGAHAQQLSYSEFSARCDKKTIVMNREGVKVAERMDGFCEGFLQGSFSSLLQSKVVCLKENEWPAGQFLLSLVATYRQEKPQAPLGEVISDSFKRYFSCGS